VPGVESASIASVLPGGFETQERALQVPGVTPSDGQQVFRVDWNAVEPGYFSTLRIPLLIGRDFTERDQAVRTSRLWAKASPVSSGRVRTPLVTIFCNLRWDSAVRRDRPARSALLASCAT
jgi:hypothetical protein